MANEEQLEILRKGVDAWNVWREVGLVERPDLSEVKLGGANLKSVDLSGVDLSSADFERQLGKLLDGLKLFYRREASA